MTFFVFLFQNGGLVPTLIGFLPFFAIFFVFYFLIIMPQKKRQKALQDMVASLKAGDKIVTSGGVIGTIASVRDTTLIIRSGDKTMLEISRNSVAGMHGELEKPQV